MRRAAGLLLLALAAGPAQSQSPGSPADIAAGIDAALPALSVQTRLLTGEAPEGTSVDAYRKAGEVEKIAVESLLENARIFREFYFERGALVRARVRFVGYNTYPRYDPKAVPPHRHWQIDPTDQIDSDDVYDFTDGRLTGWTSLGAAAKAGMAAFAASQRDILADARMFAALMNMPAPMARGGTLDADAVWACVPGTGISCQSFRPALP
jgi:hypothetical protein